MKKYLKYKVWDKNYHRPYYRYNNKIFHNWIDLHNFINNKVK